MILRLLQMIVVFAVIASNIHWHWTPNTYLAAVIGVFAAITVSAFVVACVKLFCRLRSARVYRNTERGLLH